MTWYAKPSGAYSLSSVEGRSNLFEIANILSGFTDEAISGVLGNVQAESGFNPWRWQGDRFGTSRGYGLYQYTPASDYLALSGATPNLSVSQQTTGATASDGAFQTHVFRNNTLGKWVSTCWRSYWNDGNGQPLYPALYQERARILNTWGNGSSISLSQFSQITSIYDATFVFLACFEGPLVPNLTTRVGNADNCYRVLTGEEPPTPPEPPPEPPTPIQIDTKLLLCLIHKKRIVPNWHIC